MEERIPLRERFQEKVHLDFDQIFEPELLAFIALFSWKGWMLGCFSLFYLAVPVYLFKTSFMDFTAYSVVNLILGLILFVFWGGLPALFVFYNSRIDRKKRIWAWVWTGAAAAFCVLWALVIPV